MQWKVDSVRTMAYLIEGRMTHMDGVGQPEREPTACLAQSGDLRFFPKHPARSSHWNSAVMSAQVTDTFCGHVDGAVKILLETCFADIDHPARCAYDCQSY